MSKYKELQDYLINNQNKWLITGVGGFIGSNLLEKLLTLNQKVIGLDNFITGNKNNIDQAVQDASNIVNKDVSNNFEFIHGNIEDLSTCKEACKKINYVLHQAALGSVPRSIKDPINSNKANIDGFLNIIVASKDAEVDRFVYASSSSVYGDHPDLPKVEENIGNPLSPYAVTKIVNEIYANVFSNTYGLQTIGLRYFNVFGKRQDPNGAYAAVIPKWIAAFLKNDEVIINGDGKTSRDFCYVDNAVQMNLLAATSSNNDALNQVFNVAMNNRTSLNELFEMIKEKLNNKLNELDNKIPVYKDFRPGDVRHSQADIKKAKVLMGYKPEYSISDGMDEALDWYLSNLL
tara:strand:+ start:20177 stop:21217 length:1041 start_codon:yes stop_codon:yes gene_type:complete